MQVDLNDFSIPGNGGRIGLDYALIMIHGTPGEDGMLQAYLDIMRVPYSTCGMVSTVVTFDKQLCKQTVAAAGVPVARGVFLHRGDEVSERTVADAIGGLPVFVKPNASGSSFGVTKVYDWKDLKPAVELAFRESDDVLVEEFLDGREVACGLMVAGDRELVLPLTEIVSKNDFFDYQAKYTKGFSNEITPAKVDESVALRVRELALKAYHACRCRGVVRVDFIVKKDGQPVMVEINSVPGMSAESIVPQQAACAGLTLGEMFDTVIENTRNT